jgi:RNA-binding protein
MDLTSAQRSYLTRLAHAVQPVVQIGKAGLTSSVILAISKALEDHELVKVKFQGFKDEKNDLCLKAEEATSSILVRLVGNTAIYFKYQVDAKRRQVKLPR